MRSLPVRSAASLLLAALMAACSASPTTDALDGAPSAMPAGSTLATPSRTPVVPTPAATGGPTSVPQLTPDVLADRLVRAEPGPHLVALQDIADANGGHRATGSIGFAASLSYASAVLRDAGYDVELHSFAVDGIEGTNLLAERRGSAAGVAILGAHLDSVAVGPGINDNGSGVAAVLAIAEALAELPAPERTVRLALWDAEEGGPFGSRAYVDGLAPAERDRIVAYLNFDMIASPNALRLVYDEADAPAGSDALTHAFAAHFDSAGLPWDPVDLEGDSDHGPFGDAGIPTGGLFSGGIEPVTDAQAGRFDAVAGVPADPCSHRPCDTLENVDLETLEVMTRAAASVLAGLASGG